MLVDADVHVGALLVLTASALTASALTKAIVEAKLKPKLEARVLAVVEADVEVDMAMLAVSAVPWIAAKVEAGRQLLTSPCLSQKSAHTQ